MFGFTNARGVTRPDMETEINGYNHTLWESLEQRFIAKSAANPIVGSLTRYAGFEWLVVHWDVDRGVKYLALKDIYRLASYSDSSVPGHPNVGFKGSIMETEAQEFEDLLKLRMRAPDSPAPPLDSELSQLEEIEYDGVICKVFVPTLEQMMSGFDLFKTTPSNLAETYGNFGNAIALYNGEPTAWWLADTAKSAIKPCVRENGYYYRSEATGSLCGFRPFIRMKVR